jgi:hypothetical protein
VLVPRAELARNLGVHFARATWSLSEDRVQHAVRRAHECCAQGAQSCGGTRCEFWKSCMHIFVSGLRVMAHVISPLRPIGSDIGRPGANYICVRGFAPRVCVCPDALMTPHRHAALRPARGRRPSGRAMGDMVFPRPSSKGHVLGSEHKYGCGADGRGDVPGAACCL